MRKLVLALLLSGTLPAMAQDASRPTPAAPVPVGPVETIQSQAGRIPDEAVTGFVKTFTEPSALSGKIPRWFAGICLKTQGLPAELAEAVTRRILKVAAQVGAPVQDQPCILNTTVIFSQDPQRLLDDIAARNPELLGPHDPAQTSEVAKMRYPIQAWYATETQDDKGAIAIDTKNQAALCDSTDTFSLVSDGGNLKSGGFRGDAGRQAAVANELQRNCGRRAVSGSRLRDGAASHLVAVTVIASTDTVRFHELAAVADYLALVILSQTKAFDKCERMETIANLLVPACDLMNRVTGLMPGDMAYLKALYKADTGGTLVAQQSSISSEMKRLLAAEH